MYNIFDLLLLFQFIAEPAELYVFVPGKNNGMENKEKILVYEYKKLHKRRRRFIYGMKLSIYK